jgi:Calcineurin-like phosphoesterase
MATPASPPPPDQRAKMVGWYDPVQLVKTGAQVVISSIFAANSDRRLTDAMGTPGYAPVDCTILDGGAPRRDIVIDYVADTGDGWNSTYAVAYWASRPELLLSDSEGKVHGTRRGDVLVFGGDEVYPTASKAAYERRLVAPYRTALEWTDPPSPQLYAIPGNHDWYDNLVSFSQRFVARDWLGGWETRQQRSYFALKLPHRWWLLGSDVQLASEIDKAQVDFFKKVAQDIGPDDRIILCTAEPHWVYEQEFKSDEKFRQGAENLRFLEEEILGKRVKVFLAGDLHHYRRHSLADNSVHKITAGGGGAFLHPTHAMSEEPLAGGFELADTCYPDRKTSRRLAIKNLWFIRQNWRFGLLSGVLSVLIYFTFARTLAAWNHDSLRSVSDTVASDLPLNTGALLLLFAVLAGFVAFTDTSVTWYRWFAGLTHGFLQWLFPLLAACELRALTASHWPHPTFASPLAAVLFQFLGGVLTVLFQFVAGALSGPLLIGIYLWASINIAGRHRNEAFSSLRIEDYKNFLRLHIDEKGNLHIHAIGIDRVPRADEWIDVPGASQHEPKVVPAPGGKGTAPRLIDGPIEMRSR